MVTERQLWLDIASGIMVAWMMVFHALYPMLQDNILSTIPFFFYFMPWFFYKSGMMFKVRDQVFLIKKDFVKFIKPFLTWSFIGYCCHILWHGIFDKDLSLRIAFYFPLRSLFLNAYMPLNGALWFIPILFCIRQIFNFFTKKIPAWSILVVCSGITLVRMFIDIPYLPVWISATAWGMIFFTSAYMLKGKESSLIILCISALLLLGSFFTNIPGGCQNIKESLLWYPCCLSGCLIYNYIVRSVTQLSQSLTNRSHCFPILSFIGKHSMVFYVSHYLVFKISFGLIATFLPSCYSNVWGLLIVISLYAIVGVTIIYLQNRIRA